MRWIKSEMIVTEAASGGVSANIRKPLVKRSKRTKTKNSERSLTIP